MIEELVCPDIDFFAALLYLGLILLLVPLINS